MIQILEYENLIFYKGFAKGSFRSVLLPFFQSYVEHNLRKKLNCSTIFLLIN
jgi:hypothetical protein